MELEIGENLAGAMMMLSICAVAIVVFYKAFYNILEEE